MILLLFIVVAAAPVFLEQGCTGGMGVFRIIRNVKDVVILFSSTSAHPTGSSTAGKGIQAGGIGFEARDFPTAGGWASKCGFHCHLCLTTLFILKKNNDEATRWTSVQQGAVLVQKCIQWFLLFSWAVLCLLYHRHHRTGPSSSSSRRCLIAPIGQTLTNSTGVELLS